TCLIGDECGCWPRPLGRSGWVTTPATSCRDASSASSVGTANSGVPKKTIRRMSPFSGARELPDLLHDEVALDAAHAIEKEQPVQMVHLMLEGAREQIGAFDDALLAVSIESLDDRALRARDRRVEAGHAQAAFFLQLHPFPLDERRVDEHHQDVRFVPHRKVDDENTHGLTDLRGRQAD